MFWALLTGKIDTEGLTFAAERADTEALNARASQGDLDVVAVSVARWPSIARDYLLLPHGMSVGRGYGPVVVAREPRDLASLEGARIGVPGPEDQRRIWFSFACPAPSSSPSSCR